MLKCQPLYRNMFSMGNKNIKENAECQSFEEKLNNKNVFKKVYKKSKKVVQKIHKNPSRTAKSHKDIYDK